MSSLRNLVANLNNEIEEIQAREEQLMKGNRAMEQSMERSNDTLQNEEQRNKYLEKKLKLLSDDRAATLDLLEMEKKRTAELTEQQLTLAKELKKARVTTENEKREKEDMVKVLKKSNDMHDDEKEQLKRLLMEKISKEEDSLMTASYEKVHCLFFHFHSAKNA